MLSVWDVEYGVFSVILILKWTIVEFSPSSCTYQGQSKQFSLNCSQFQIWKVKCREGFLFWEVKNWRLCWRDDFQRIQCCDTISEYNETPVTGWPTVWAQLSGNILVSLTWLIVLEIWRSGEWQVTSLIAGCWVGGSSDRNALVMVRQLDWTDWTTDEVHHVSHLTNTLQGGVQHGWYVEGLQASQQIQFQSFISLS